jgi:TPR repeat protein
MEHISVRKLAALEPAAFAAILTGPPARAAAWIAAAAENGIVEAQAVYGQYLLSGHGVDADPVAALTWFKHAADARHPMGMNMVGRCYELGWGTAPHLDVAVYWYRLAAHAGLDWGMYNFGTALALGRGIAEDRVEALAWFKRAAALGHAKSVNFIGGFHEDGWVVEQNLEIAFEHYGRAAHAGDFRGQYNYARMLAARGRAADAAEWMRRVVPHATPAFLLKARAHLSVHPDPVMRALADIFPDSAATPVTGGHADVVPSRMSGNESVNPPPGTIDTTDTTDTTATTGTTSTTSTAAGRQAA